MEKEYGVIVKKIVAEMKKMLPSDARQIEIFAVEKINRAARRKAERDRRKAVNGRFELIEFLVNHKQRTNERAV